MKQKNFPGGKMSSKNSIEEAIKTNFFSHRRGHSGKN